MLAEHLTARQRSVLAFIRTKCGEGLPPTRAEINRYFGFSSPNAADCHLRSLAKHGAIILVPSVSRGILLPSQQQQKVYGRLTVLQRRGEDTYCQCSCGNLTLVRWNNLSRGKTKSCGCWRRDEPRLNPRENAGRPRK